MVSFYMLVFCTSLILASTLRDEKRIEKCSKMICPPVKATICVKVKEHNTQRRYVMMSKCELKLMKCFGEMNTTVVTAKYCNALRQGDLSGDKEKDPAKESDVPVEQEDSVDMDKSIEGPHEAVPVDQEDPVKELNPDEIPQEHVPVDDPTGQKEVDKESDTDAMLPKEEPANASNPPGKQHEENPVGQEVPANEPELVEIQPEHGEINDDNDGEKKELDIKENEEQSGSACPESCPTLARRFVCARCSHGVYRTFFSSCFMRMYQCRHPNEKLELVSRRACTASAPYLGEMPRPSSEVVEPQYDDIVFNHIYGLPNF